MTINELQMQLIKEIGRLTDELPLMDAGGRPAKLKGYEQAVPIVPTFEAVPYDEDSEPDLFPYFIIRVDGVEYQKTVDGLVTNLAHIMIAFAIQDDDAGLKGYRALTSVMERVVERFQSDTVLGEFWCERQMNLAYQEDDTYPQFFGALEMAWHLPDISMDLGMEESL